MNLSASSREPWRRRCGSDRARNGWKRTARRFVHFNEFYERASAFSAGLRSLMAQVAQPLACLTPEVEIDGEACPDDATARGHRGRRFRRPSRHPAGPTPRDHRALDLLFTGV